MPIGSLAAKEPAQVGVVALVAVAAEPMWQLVPFGIESMKTGDATEARRKVDATSDRLLRLVDAEVARIDGHASKLGGQVSLALWISAILLLGLGSLGAFLLVR